ncbi:MAG TPA: extracellular solute-binding protein [Acidobacteriaceae bacterium]|nr:extracellular solute-binding protein [Acidobacteriaceae bacterium]
MTTIRLLVRDFSDFENAVAAEVAAFHRAQNEIRVVPEVVTLHQLYDVWFGAGGMREGRWDLGLLVTDWLAQAMEERVLEDLAPWMRRQPLPGWPDGWAQSIAEPVCFGNSVSSLPWHDGPECLIYRRDWFDDPAEQAAFRNEYGYELQPPRTWSEFADAARFFTRPEEGRYGTLFAAYPDGHNTLYDFALQLWSRGGSLVDRAGRASLASNEALSALDFYRATVRDEGMCHPDSQELNSTHSGDVFLEGGVALMVNWFGFAARSDRAGSPLEGKVGIAAIPADPGCPPVSLSVFWTIGMARSGRNQAAAWEFLRFLGRPDVDLARSEHGTVPVRLSSWRNADLQLRVPGYARIEEISLSARRLPRSRSLPAFAEIVDLMLVDALTTNEPSAAILERAQQRIVERGISFA